MVFHCYWDTVPVYVTAELLGALLAALLTMPLYGFGPHVSAGSQPTAEIEVTSTLSSPPYQ
jgi:glycerol uptake facilitator-like aquaporin